MIHPVLRQIQEHVEQKEIRLVDVAHRLGNSDQTIRRWLNGEVLPSLVDTERLAGACGLVLSWDLSDREED